MIKTERSRGKYADYSDCIDDDFSVIDSDDSVCDDDRDGLLPNEIQSYNQELKEIDEFAKLFGIEVVPSIQTLAHMNQIFRWDEYKTINEKENSHYENFSKLQ